MYQLKCKKLPIETVFTQVLVLKLANDAGYVNSLIWAKVLPKISPNRSNKHLVDQWIYLKLGIYRFCILISSAVISILPETRILLDADHLRNETRPWMRQCWMALWTYMKILRLMNSYLGLLRLIAENPHLGQVEFQIDRLLHVSDKNRPRYSLMNYLSS